MTRSKNTFLNLRKETTVFMKKKILAVILIITMFSVNVLAAVPTESEAYSKIASLREKYPEGTPWSGGNYYAPTNGVWYGARACMGFAMLVSDAVFGDLPARTVYSSQSNPINISDLRVGDILRLPGHSCIVFEKKGDHIIIMEGNWEGRVHWGRKITAAQVARASYYTTRYPEGYKEPEPSRDSVVVNRGGDKLLYKDIEGHWAKDSIVSCIETGLISGAGSDGDMYFFPDREATRAELVVMLYRADGSPEVSGKSPFSDVTDEWYSKAVIWAQKNGIVSGTSEGIFSPNLPITREALSTILYRYAGIESPKNYSLAAFKDSAEVSDYARKAIGWANENKIINGSGGFLNPKKNATRAELATILVRFSSVLMKL